MLLLRPDRWRQIPKYRVEARHIPGLRRLLLASPDGTLFRCFDGDQATYTFGSSMSNRGGGVRHGSAVAPYVPSAIDNANTSASGINVTNATVSTALSVVAHAERVGTVSTSGIPFVLNTRSGTESNYIGVDFGTRFAASGSKNKVTVTAVGTAVTSGNLFLNGIDQGGTSSVAEIASNDDVVIAGAFSTTAGTAYELLAKIEPGAGGFCFPISLYCYAEFDRVLSAGERQAYSAAPYGELFIPKPARIYSFAVAAPSGFQPAWARNTNVVINPMGMAA